jgi:DNA-binding beta-propeller fold protein YncE
MKRVAVRRTLIAAGIPVLALAGVFPLPAALGAATPETAGRLRLMQVIENGVDGVEGLFGARSAAVSPDGAHVYVVSAIGDSLVVFGRDPDDGRLAFVEVHRDGVDGADALADARQVVVSPDGAHVYVARSFHPSIRATRRWSFAVRLVVQQRHPG